MTSSYTGQLAHHRNHLQPPSFAKAGPMPAQENYQVSSSSSSPSNSSRSDSNSPRNRRRLTGVQSQSDISQPVPASSFFGDEASKAADANLVSVYDHTHEDNDPPSIAIQPPPAPPDSLPVDIELSDLDSNEPPPWSPAPPREPQVFGLGGETLRLPAAVLESGSIYEPEHAVFYIDVEEAPKQQGAVSTPAGPSTPNAASTLSPGLAVPKASETGAAVTGETAPPASMAELRESKPHPKAIFIPALLEWRLVLPEAELCVDGFRPSLEAALDSEENPAQLNEQHLAHMYQTGPVTVAPESQRLPVTLLSKPPTEGSEAPSTAFVEVFNLHQCALTSRAIFSSVPQAIPSVLPVQLLDTFRVLRTSDPPIGLTGAEAFRQSARVMLRIIGNAINGETRGVPLIGKSVAHKLGWDEPSKTIFFSLGWQVDILDDGREALMPPKMQDDNALSQLLRKRVMRAWTELYAWFLFHQSGAQAGVQQDVGPFQLSMRDATSDIRALLGAEPSQVTGAYSGWDSPVLTTSARDAFVKLGASSDTTDELLKYAYSVNLYYQTAPSMELTSAIEVIHRMQRPNSNILKAFLEDERSRGMYTYYQVNRAYNFLQCGGDGVDYSSIPQSYVVDLYLSRMRTATVEGSLDEAEEAKEALKTIAVSRGNPPELLQALDAKVEIDPQQAYNILEVASDLDEKTLVALYEIRVSDQPGKSNVMKEALHSIAEDRNSNFLRNFIRTGEKSEDVWQQPPSSDRPAGLNNIGNTCYLNSVLQYFFTIRELRDRVLEASKAGALDSKNNSSSPRRVGGRELTPREIARSHKFVVQLSGLFSNMIYAPSAAVTPERELAYLALVSSRAEEDDEAAHGGAVSTQNEPGSSLGASALSSGTDATLVDEPGPIASPVDMDETSQPPALDATAAQTGTSNQPAVMSSPLGSGAFVAAESTAVDPATSEPPASVAVTRETSEGPVESTALSSTVLPDGAEHGAALEPEDVVMASTEESEPKSRAIAPGTNPPPLPPRPKLPAANAPARQNSLMQFGAQQDVSECLDNVMFQVEVALGSSSALESPKDERESEGDLLQKLFVGRTCQRLELTTEEDIKSASGSVHKKEEVFKILPVDVLEEGRDMYDGLDGFFDEETLVGSGGKPVRRTVTLLEPPPLLQIQLQRVQYDRASMRAFKSQAHLEMGEKLYMDRYLDFDPANPEDEARLTKRKEATVCRKEIASLRARMTELRPNQTPMASTLSQTSRFLKGLSDLEPIEGHESSLSSLVEPSFVKAIDDEATALANDIAQMSTRVSQLKEKVEKIWQGEERVEYQLAAVFMHRGEASHGHYFLNQRRLPSEDGKSNWFRYNDSDVSKVSLTEVLRDTTGATPYLLAYVRRDLQDSELIIETVKRCIDEPTPVPMSDGPMQLA